MEIEAAVIDLGESPHFVLGAPQSSFVASVVEPVVLRI